MKWYFLANNVEQGPVTEVVISELIKSGVISGNDFVRSESMASWIAPSEFRISEGPVKVDLVKPAHEPRSQDAEFIPTYMAQAVVCVLFLCLPTALPAIYYADKVGTCQRRKMLSEAKLASRKAKLWCLISLYGALAFWAIVFLFVFLY